MAEDYPVIVCQYLSLQPNILCKWALTLYIDCSASGTSHCKETALPVGPHTVNRIICQWALTL